MIVLILFAVISIIAISAISWFISVGNRLRKVQVTIDESAANISLYLAKRYDILTESAKVVRRFTEHENKIFDKLIECRKGMNLSDAQKAAAQQDKAISQLVALAEDVPELKSSEVYVQLQKSLEDQTEHYYASKRIYNSNITQYNQLIVTFPISIVASMQNMAKLPFYDEDTTGKEQLTLDI